ncbi:MAG: OmpA family protein [Bacteroidetes bacterium]|nr:OmpA family protein [Bacteroidota bacterium]MDA1119590.1 OmpA family protein [Bacteroidota bacterium]
MKQIMAGNAGFGHRRRGILCLWILILTCFHGYGQKNIVIPIDSALINEQFNLFEFKNINKIADYRDEARLERIYGLDKAERWEELYHALKDYAGNFGIRNFYSDTYLIWKLAKLTELFGDAEEAKSLYRLVLKHHQIGIDIKEIELYYDSLNTQEIELYVPIDYYYELVEYRKAIDTLQPPRGVLLNMGGSINSRLADYGPSLSVNDQTLIFTSKRNEKVRHMETVKNEDLFFSRRDGRFWSQSEEIPGINTIYNEGSAYLSRDGKTLYFSRCDSPDSYGDCDIFVTAMQADSTWGEVKNLGVNVNSLAWDSHPALSHGEDTLYFASDRIGGFGLSDIYFTYKLRNGGWAEAQNIGPVINTRHNEVSPFYHPEYDMIYFSSNGQLYVFGEYDIYKTYKFGKSWTEPKNIGPLVNGIGSEFYFTIDSKSEYLFYARTATQDLDKMDLYSFPLPNEAKPGALTRVRGSLLDSLTGKPFSGIVSIIDLDDGVEVAPKYLKADGSFEFDLINNKNYLLIIQGDDFFRIEEMFYLQGPAEFNKLTDPISSRVKFESIQFGNSKADLRPEMFGDLNKLVNFMYDNPDFLLRISGHTDSSGNEAFNLQLSKERAKNIRDYIVLFGDVEGHRVEAEGFGSAKPLVEETDEERRSLNRRVEFEIYRPGIAQPGSGTDN